MEHAHNPKLPPLTTWVTEPDYHWFGRCDDCGKRHIRLALYDCWPPHVAPSGFWWICADCLIHDVSALATAKMEEAPA